MRLFPGQNVTVEANVSDYYGYPSQYVVAIILLCGHQCLKCENFINSSHIRIFGNIIPNLF